MPALMALLQATVCSTSSRRAARSALCRRSFCASSSSVAAASSARTSSGTSRTSTVPSPKSSHRNPQSASSSRSSSTAVYSSAASVTAAGVSSSCRMGGSVRAFSTSNRILSWAACLSMSHTFRSASSQMIYVFSTSPATRQGCSAAAGPSGMAISCCSGSAAGAGEGVVSGRSAVSSAGVRTSGGVM